MDCSNARRSFYALAVAAAVIIQLPRPANAFHIRGISVTPTSIVSATRTVKIDIVESTVGTGSVHSHAFVQWGDAVSSYHAWMSTTGAGPKLYHVSGVSHVYPDLTTRTIQVRSDCCNTTLGYDFDSAVVDFACTDLPMGVCDASATSSQLQLKQDSSDHSKDKLMFKWLKGTVASFGDPTGTTEYYLCIYAPGLVAQSVVPAVTNWSASGGGFKYQEGTGAAGGLTKIKLKTGTGKAKILIKGAGVNLPDPALPLTQPVLVQLQNNNGQCWQHQFTSPEIKNDTSQFKDKE